MIKHLNVPLDEELIHKIKLKALSEKKELKTYVKEVLEVSLIEWGGKWK